MVTGKQIVKQARTWIDTPFKHQGRLKGAGVDCVGLVIGVAHELDISNFDTANYSRVPNVSMMGKLLTEHLDEIAIDDAKDGDIYWMVVKSFPQHLAIKSDKGIIHSTSAIGKCIETSLDDTLKAKIFKAFRYKGKA